MSLKITIQAFLVLHLFVNISAGLSDYTHLMKKYYLLCGPEYFCLPPIKTYQWEVSPNLSYQHMKVCPECQCDKACIKRGDCCADLYFSFPDLVCVNRTIINGRYEKDRTEQSSALMVTSCPADSKTKSKEKCSLYKDTRYRLRNFPVTGLDFPLSYYNKYCAECNGVKNYTFWTLDINCSFFADFNFLSTIDEVIDMAFDRECIFQAIQDDDTFSEIKQENCFDIDERRTLFTKCNQTGEWLTYDSNIAYACESFYKRKYRLFKNMFCYMCNPSGRNLLAKDMITTCNITGQWMTYDSGLQQACLDLPQTLETKPFKNIFCYLCNRGNDSSQIFVDILGQFYENPINDVEYPYIYYLDITDFNLDFFNHVSKRKMEKDKSLSKVIHSQFALSSFRTNDGTLINITNLLLQKAAMEMREIQVCDSRNFVKPTEYSDCTCDISCLFVRDKCCDDLSLQVPMHCRRTSLHDPTKENTKGIPTLNGCFQETTRNFIKKGCTLPESGDIFSQIPLTKVNGVNYDNFYCVLCNLNSGGLVKKMQGNFSDQEASQTSSETNDADFIDHYLNIRSQFEIWDLNIVCPQYLDYSHYLKVGDVIEIAKRMQCRIRFIEKTEGSHECLLSRGAKIRCADLSDWTYSDKDVEWACNNLIDFQGYPANIFTKSIPEEFDSSREKNYRYYSKGYTNVYCAICKPNSKFPEYFIDNCTLSRDSYLCSYYPRIYYYYPFKNIHCTLCNNISFGSVRDSYHDPGPNINIPIAGINWFPILRNMFSVHDDDTTEVVDSSTGKCKSNQVYDPYKVPMHCRHTLLHDPTEDKIKNIKGIPTVNGCFQETTRDFIKKGCTLPESGDIFSRIPITKVNGVNYDNFYCVLCNLNSDGLVKKMQGHFSDQKSSQTSSETNDADYIDHYLNIRNQFQIWDLNIVCPQYLDYSHYLKVGDVIEIAKRMQCRIRFIEKNEGSQECLLSGRLLKLRCADLSDWTYSDQDVEWACNNLIEYPGFQANIFEKSLPEEFDSSREKNYRFYSAGYTNVYCAICKPNSKFPEYFIDNCTISRNSYLCSYYPRIYYYYPFKNIHCTLCNNINFTSVSDLNRDPRPNIYRPIAGINWFPILRNIFSIHDDDATEIDTSNGQCKSNQVYDKYQDLCRNITCFSGKYLVNNECIPLLIRTMNLQYSMAFSTGTYNLKEGIPNVTLISLTDAFIQKVDSYFRSKLNVKPLVKVVAMEEYKREDGKTRNDCMFIRSKIFFRSSVPRLLIERYLISLRHRFQDSCIESMTHSNDRERIEKRETARIKKRFVTEPFYFGYFTAKVSNILVCPQIELDEDEYNTSEVNSFLTLTRNGFENKNLVFDEFATTPSGRLRICLEYLQNINYFPLSSGTISVDMKKKYLWILSLASSTMSMISLMLGLICYLILPRLRTIPGKLIIMLMTSLLFTLIFQQFSYLSVQSGYGCISTAIFLHFSWLSLFICTQMANFHSWRTFTSKEVVSHTSDRILLKFLACILGAPTCLICINIIDGLIRHSDPFGGYGGSKCFIKDTYMLIALFICPVALICLLNIAFFSLTARAIKLTPKAESNQKKRDDLAIFVRLTTVTGVSWLLQIIDSFLPFTYFTFISTAINSLQGCFIFLAFIVNKRVIDLLRKRLCLADDVNSMQTRSEYLSSSRNTSQL
ncbi:hypothetical protein FSP39_014723 [Pinctada imbricata]|uniref:G-protein coupled receptors family 2 profile 2 domain-containing protein n=1 Tax=Pinctada imbricata TaxID=66713 RepID=A0AA88YB07_PINIB|nr:hypothetical protein FSP39_014723 [Pinctada imbricata]